MSPVVESVHHKARGVSDRLALGFTDVNHGFANELAGLPPAPTPTAPYYPEHADDIRLTP